MAVLVGIHCEGWDHLILLAYLAKLLGISETDLKVDFIEAPGRGWQFVEDLLPKALKRFYHQCAQLALVAQDNDGNLDLQATGLTEDPARPRHWNHAGTFTEVCRCCRLNALVDRTRAELTWLPEKPGNLWPIVVTVPVEMIEAWLLTTLAVVRPGLGSLYAELERRQNQKHRFYGKPEPTKSDVEMIALPLIRAAEADHLDSVKKHSRSFAHFSGQIDQYRNRALDSRDCWQSGDRGGER